MSTADHHYLLHGLAPEALGSDFELPGLWNDQAFAPAWQEALDAGWSCSHVG